MGNYSARAIVVVVMIAGVWGVREFIGNAPDHGSMLLAMTPLLLGTAFSIVMSKLEFDRTNEVGVTLYSSFWHSSLWTLLRVLNTLFLIAGGLIALVAVFSV